MRPYPSITLPNRLMPALLLGLAVGLAGCQANKPRKTVVAKVTPPVPAKALPLPFKEPGGAPKELSSDILFSYLVAEIGAQRAQFEEAYGHYLHAAILTKDPYAAERATLIGVHTKQRQAALRAVRHWVALAPNSIKARAYAAGLLMANDEADAALAELEALHRIATARRTDGFLRAVALLAKNRPVRKQIRLMRRWVASHSDDVRSHFALALLERAAKLPKSAEGTLRDGIKVDPTHIPSYVQLVNLLVATKRRDEAISALEAAIKVNPESRVLRINLARLLVDAKRYERALAEYEALSKERPGDEDVRLALGMLQTRLERWGSARKTWQTLRASDKHSQEATYFLGLLEEQAGNKTLAMGLYGSVSKKSLRVDAGLRLAQLQGETGDTEGAKATFKRLRLSKTDREAEIYVAEGALFQDLADYDYAEQVFNLAVQAHPGDTDVLYGRALLYAEMGKVDAAERDLLAVLKVKPNNANALNALGYTLADLTGRYQEALGYILQAYRLSPKDASILDSLGWVYYRLGKLDEAVRYLSQALEVMHDSEIAAHLGEVLYVHGQQDKARRVWNEALRRDPRNPKLRATMDRFK